MLKDERRILREKVNSLDQNLQVNFLFVNCVKQGLSQLYDSMYSINSCLLTTFVKQGSQNTNFLSK